MMRDNARKLLVYVILIAAIILWSFKSLYLQPKLHPEKHPEWRMPPSSPSLAMAPIKLDILVNDVNHVNHLAPAIPKNHVGAKFKSTQSSSTEHQFIETLEPMALSLDYWEQLGNGLANLFDLQCWANSVGINKVMEPFVRQGKGSAYGLPIPEKEYFTFSEVFDIDAWNKMSEGHSFAKLVPVETLIKNAFKEILFIQIHFVTSKAPCLPMSALNNSTKHNHGFSWYQYFTGIGFRIVDTVCIDFNTPPTYSMTAKSFREKIFEKWGHNVTLVFSKWSGLREQNADRVSVRGTHCANILPGLIRPRSAGLKLKPHKPVKVHSMSVLYSSSRISRHVKQFRSEFMSGVPYVAVMMRTEKFKLVSDARLSECQNNIISDWKKMTARSSVKKTLVFSDAGKHGSTTWNNSKSVIFSEAVQTALKVEHSLEELNIYLEKITGSKSAVFIAAVQREIIAQAACIIQVGGGFFQAQTLHMFSHFKDGLRGELCYSVRDAHCHAQYM